MLGSAAASIVLILLHTAGAAPALPAAAVCFALFIAAVLRKRGASAALLPLALLIAVSLSLYRTDIMAESTNRALRLSHETELLVIDEPQYENGRLLLKARVRRHPVIASGTGIQLSMSYDSLGTADMGDIISVRTKITSASAQLSLGNRANGIFARASCEAAPAVIGSSRLLRSAAAVREYARYNIQSKLPQQESAALCALIIGDRSAVSEELENAVRGAGLSHVLVVSGMHFATVMSGFSLLMRRLRLNRKLQALLSVAVIIFFSAVCGFTMSVLRAGITYLLAAGAVLLNRDGEPINLLSGAVSIILSFSPYAVFSISFELSVLATVGVLVIMPPASQAVVARLPSLKPFKWAIDAFIGSLAAMLLTMPVTVWYFGGFSAAAPVANVLISYPVTWALLAAAAAVLLSPLPFISKPLILAAGLLVRWFCAVASFFGTDGLMIKVGKWGSLMLAAVIIVLLAAVYSSRERRIYLKLKRVMENEPYN